MSQDEKPFDDAWKQHHDLLERFHREWNVRRDLKVEALACDRNVRFSLAYSDMEDPSGIGMTYWHDTQRNVGTMRELAEALIAACDFVEAANPEWASHFSDGLVVINDAVPQS